MGCDRRKDQLGVAHNPYAPLPLLRSIACGVLPSRPTSGTDGGVTGGKSETNPARVRLDSFGLCGRGKSLLWAIFRTSGELGDQDGNVVCCGYSSMLGRMVLNLHGYPRGRTGSAG
jgi:hypothetical protein